MPTTLLRNMLRSMLRNKCSIAVTLALIYGCTGSTNNEDIVGQQAARVIRVIDGDTIETDLGIVRIIGIDTPEIDECGYREASERLSSLVEQKQVSLISDSTHNDKDEYDRLLRYIEIDQQDIGEMMIKEGFATVFPWFGGDRINAYSKIEVRENEAVAHCK